MIVAVVGAREISSIRAHPSFKTKRHDLQKEMIKSPKKLDTIRSLYGDQDISLIQGILDDLRSRFGENLSVVSIGCDDGIGLIVKNLCQARRILFTEFSCVFFGRGRPRQEFSAFYMARNAALVELCDMFYIVLNEQRTGMMEELLGRVRALEEPRPVIVYDAEGNHVEDAMAQKPSIGGDQEP